MSGSDRKYLEAADLDQDPLVQFGRWFAEAGCSGVPDPEAMCLATADAAGQPSARMLLLKGFDESGFVFFTNYESRKARELEENPRAALNFYWPSLGRQVRIEGQVTRISHQESRLYFDSRPFESRLGAWASDQSRPLESRAELDRRMAELTRRFAEQESLELPPFWGGYRLRPETIEFWQQGPNRLHDRFRYERAASGWTSQRIFP